MLYFVIDLNWWTYEVNLIQDGDFVCENVQFLEKTLA